MSQQLCVNFQAYPGQSLLSRSARWSVFSYVIETYNRDRLVNVFKTISEMMKLINILVIIFLLNRKQKWLNLVDRQSFSSGVRVRVSASGQRRLCWLLLPFVHNSKPGTAKHRRGSKNRRNFTMWNGHIAGRCRYLTCGSDTSWFSCQIWKFSVLRLSDVPRGIVHAFVHGPLWRKFAFDPW